MSSLSAAELNQFQRVVYDHYQGQGRDDLPWRVDTSPYAVFVSELMLQQTQVARVIPKFDQWLEQFPDFETLAAADQADVLRAWQGLGYNRRARWAHQSAQMVVHEFDDKLPQTCDKLFRLPGVGKNTAGAIMAYAFNKPAVYVETNIRTVFIHHFFSDGVDVSDSEILELVDQSLDRDNPRSWYWALMDYGVHLKQIHGNLTRQSKVYRKQSAFEGSFRQLRAKVLRTVLASSMTQAELAKSIHDSRLQQALTELTAEGLITESEGSYSA